MSTENQNEKLSAFLDKIEKLPTLPLVASQIFSKMSDPDFDMKAVVNMLMMDQVLTAKILQMVNSAFWSGGQRVDSIRQAIVRLGAKNVRNFVLSTSIMEIVPGSAKSKLLKSFWQHSLACALLGGYLAKNIGYKDPERAYLAGLLHDIGEIVLIMNFPDDFDKVVEEAHSVDWDFNKAEMNVLGISHVHFGPWLLKQWNMFGEIAHAVARHHKPETAITDPTLVAVTHLVDLFSRMHGMSIGDPHDISIDLLANNAWDVLRQESNNSHNFNPEKQIDHLSERLEETKELVEMVYT